MLPAAIVTARNKQRKKKELRQHEQQHSEMSKAETGSGRNIKSFL